MPLWGGLRIGVREQRAVDAAVGDREGAALQIGERQLVVLDAPPAKSAMACSMLGEAQRGRRARITGTTRPALGADGDADVVVVRVDDVGRRRSRR